MPNSKSLSADQRLALEILADRKLSALTDPLAEYCPQIPTEKQREFLDIHALEAFYGGAAGGAKSSALLMAALQYVHIPGYAALILRRSYSDLALPGAIMDRAREWLLNTDAKWSEKNKTWTFPSGAKLTFGFLERDSDRFRYAGANFQFIAFDELTQFSELQYLYLFSRLRKNLDSNVPCRVRAASNPGGVGHDWVKTRFLLAQSGARVFIPALISDNPHLDAENYEKSLNELDAVTREQLLNGDWDIRPNGSVFRYSDFEIIEEQDLPDLTFWVRAWDLAAKTKQEHDYTVGVLMGVDEDQTLYIKDVRRFKLEYADARPQIISTAHLDTPLVPIGVEDKVVGTALVSDLLRDPQMLGFSITPLQVSRDKKVSAQGWSSRARNGKLKLLRGAWNRDFINECVAFNGDGKGHDDQVDATSRAFALLVMLRGGVHRKPEPIPAGTHEYYKKLYELNSQSNYI